MSEALKEEVDRLFNTKERIYCHPEDLNNNSEFESSSESEDESQPYVHSDSEEDTSHNMVSRAAAYTIPTTQFDANTGPKGVISDAQSFERAKKRSFRRTLLGVTGFDNQPSSRPAREDTKLLRERRATEGSVSEEDEEQFMRRWREARMQELQQRARSKTGPSKKMYGSVELVDAVGYLDAIEKVPPDTVVVVCIYDPEVRLPWI